MINYVMHICVDKSLEFSYHMFNCNLLQNLMNVLPVDTICSIEYCGEFAFYVPIQNGIFLFICSIEYSGEFSFCVPIQNGIFLF